MSVSDRTLTRLIRGGLLALVVGILVVVGVHFLYGGPDHGPTLLERQIEAAEAAVKKTPDRIEPRLGLAQVYLTASRPESALEQYDEVLKVDPAQKAALLGRAGILLDRGDLGGAAKSYEKVVQVSKGGEFAKVDQQLEQAYYGIATIALKQGRAKEAATAAQAALKIAPTDADAWYLLGTANVKAGAPEPAVEALRQAILFVPTGWCEPYAALSQAYAQLGRQADAEYAGAMLDFCQKKPEVAAQRLQALVSGPAALDAMLGLGMIAEAQADRPGAIRWYEQVLVADPKNFNALAGLSRLGAAPQTETPGSSTSTGEAT